ncbi:MAG: sulfotransferase [Pseudomonadota bacterium]
MAEKQRFFAYGLPKSGTTLLQYTLNAHPQVSCPSEHYFINYLYKQLKQTLAQYDQVLATVNHRTGGVNADVPTSPILNACFARVCETMIDAAAGEKPIAGANDNAFMGHIDSLSQLFPRAKFVVIFRNPIERAVSAYHHNLKLYRETGEVAHKQLIDNAGGFEPWVRGTVANYSKFAERYCSYAQSQQRLLLIRFEDLAERKRETLTTVFQFLGATVDNAILDKLLDITSFQAMRSQASRPAFFRSGRSEKDESISMGLRQSLESEYSNALNLMGYANGDSNWENPSVSIAGDYIDD